MYDVLVHVNTFSSLFAGNNTFRVVNTYSLTQKQEEGKKLTSSKPPTFSDEAVTEKSYIDHLSGKSGLGICPITADGKCSFAVIDIDVYGGEADRVIDIVYENEIPILPFRSKSGGVHLYVFLNKAVKPASIKTILEKFILLTGIEERFGKGVEIFPKQVKLSSAGKGNCITIPYYGIGKERQYLIGPDRQKVELEDALKIMKKAKTTLEELETSFNNLPFADAPRCVQAILIGGGLREGGGRNNFIFTASIYAKKKLGAAFPDLAREMNDLLDEPLESEELENIIKSVADSEPNYKCGDIPCKQYCKSAECAKREFGVGREKGYFTGLDYGVMTRIKAKDPYYLWQLRRMKSAEDDTESDFVEIVFNDATQIMEQRSFAKIVFNKLNVFPARVNDNDWFKVVNKYSIKMEEREVDIESDTSETAELYQAIIKYLTARRNKSAADVLIKVGLSILRNGRYYFTVDGLSAYLRSTATKFKQNVLHDTLQAIGAVFGDFEYDAADGKQTIKCWSIEQTEELAEKENYYTDVIAVDTKAIEAAVGVQDEEAKEELSKAVQEEEELDEDDDSLF